MRNAFKIAGLAAGGVLVVFEIVAIAMGVNGRNKSRRTFTRSAAAAGVVAVGLLSVFVLAGSAGAVTPPTVLLGVAGQFAVLAGSGITNTGPTTISGDTGSSQPNTSETGFAACPAADCVTQTGTNHTQPEPNDQTTQDAKTALRTAYADAAGRAPTTVLTELGGQSLVAGVYSSASGNFGMSGTLTLDGQGNADSVFIFQTAAGTGTLITGGAGNVVLENGAQACNIFWQVGTSATLGGGSTLMGTVLANTSISVGGAVTVVGRLLAGEQPSGTGAVTLINDTIAMPSTCVTQASVNAAAAAAAAQAATAAAAAQAAAAQAAAAQAAAAQATAASLSAAQAIQAANTAAATAAVAAAAKAASIASAKAAAATKAAKQAATAAKIAIAKAKLAKVAKAKAVAATALAAAKLAAAKALVAKAAAAKAAAAAKTAAAKVAAAKALTTGSVGAKSSNSSAGFTG